jgi:predicted ATPase
MMRSKGKYKEFEGEAPFLRKVELVRENVHHWGFPFDLPILKDRTFRLTFEAPVTIFVGENGSGKSTVLEAIAQKCGFNLEGGNRNHLYSGPRQESAALAPALRLSWFPRVSTGFFLRAESFFNFASYIDSLAEEDPNFIEAYGGKSLHRQSHGESFLSLFENRFGRKGIYILDEPEAALSPMRQLSFMRIIHELEETKQAQFLIATHSPILLTYPGAEVIQFDQSGSHKVDYRDTEHFQLTHDYLNSPERFLRNLFADDEEEEEDSDD